jgi:two-component system response regulator YesN
MAIAERPDLIFLDIKMPRMDGIEMMRQLQNHAVESSVVVLSCHDDFELVRQAMKLGAMDYVRKLSLKPREIEDFLVEIRDAVSARAKCNASRRSGAGHANHFPLQALFAGDSVEQCIRAIREPIGGDSALYVMRSPDGNMDLSSSLSIIAETTKEVVGPFGKCSFVDGRHGDVVALVHARPGNALDEQQAVSFGRRMKTSIELVTGLVLMVGVSHIGGRLLYPERSSIRSFLDRLGKAYEEAKAATADHFYRPEVDVFCWRYVPPNAIEEATATAARTISQVEQAIRTGQEHEATKALGEFFDDLNADSSVPPGSVRALVVELISTVLQEMRTLQIGEEAPIEDEEGVYREALGVPTKAELEQWTFDVLAKYFTRRNCQPERPYYSPYIDSLRKYVYEHFPEHISLKTAAAQVHLNESYLSALFKERTGQSFTSFVNGVRIEKARDLLAHDGLTVTDAAYQVGFENPSYFSTLFKRVMGVSPNEVKRRV